MHAVTGSGFRDVEHTADVALEVWADSIGELVRMAVLGMMHIMEVETTEDPKILYDLKIIDADHESQLIQLLNQVILTMELKKQAPKDIFIKTIGITLTAKMNMVPVVRIKKMIKAATYNGLKMIKTGNGLRTSIVFDV